MWERLGYVRTGEAPERMQKTIELRGRELAIDETLLAFEKPLRSDRGGGGPRTRPAA